jgi:copper chaperone
MITEKINVENLKCSGCASAIRNALLKIAGMQNVEVDLEAKTVTVIHNIQDRSLITKILREIGYPEIDSVRV